ncbi:MAG: PAS domain S-box protein [Candidatus Omnitrophota bacterium]|nr:PAS domain S-box protein [Candidatus Omnitrophota bacterium]
MQKERNNAQQYLDVAGALLVVIDVEQKVVRINKKGCEILGYEKEEELIGKSYFDTFIPERSRDEVIRVFKLLAAGEVEPAEYFENPVLTKSGEEKILAWHNAVLRDEQGKIYAIVCSGEDITERKRAEEALLESEKRYHDIFDATIDSLLIFDLDGTIMEANPQACEMYGYSYDELIGLSGKDIVHPDYYHLFGQFKRDVQATGKFYAESVDIHKDGSSFNIEVKGTPVTCKGKPHLLAVIRDITERKRAEEKLREREKQLNAVLDNATIHIWAFDGERYLYLSKEWYRYTGQDPDLPRTIERWTEVVHPDDLDKAARTWYKAWNSKGVYDDHFRLKNAEGNYRLFHSQAIPLYDENGEFLHYQGYNIDVTERKLSEEHLRIYAKRQEEAAKFGKVAMSDISIDELMDKAVILISRVLDMKYSKVLEHFPEEKKLFLKAGVGWKKGWVGHLTMPDGIRSQGGFSLLSDKPVISEDIANEKRFSPPPLLTEHNVASGLTVVIPGKERPYGILAAHTVKKRHFSNDDANFIQTIANVLADAIELKREKEKLRESEERFRQVAENAEEWIWETDSKGLYTYASSVSEKILGYKPEELVGKKHFYDLFHPEDREELKKGVFEIFTKKQPVKEFINRNLHKDKSIVWLLKSGTPLLDEKEDLLGYRGVDMDITERRKAEEELEEHRKHLEELVESRTRDLAETNKELESFSYSVSHDLRAPLRGMDGFSQALLEDYADKLDDKGKDYLRRVRGASRRMGRLIEDLLVLSRVTRREIKTRSVNLSRQAEEIVKGLQKTEPQRRVKITVQNGIVAYGDPHLLDIMLENLLDNAWKFTGKQSDAKVEFGAAKIKGEEVFFVRDNGVGFDMRYADKLFGAFQRLHSENEFPGTGIGLATVNRIIRRHGGRIWAESDEGKGAVFYFYLPKQTNRRAE